MALLDDAKKALRISAGTTAFDDEVQDLIAAAQADMVDSGIAESVATAEGEEQQPAIKRAILVYCKAHFGFNNPDADRLAAIYNKQVQKLSLITEYREGAADVVESNP